MAQLDALADRVEILNARLHADCDVLYREIMNLVRRHINFNAQFDILNSLVWEGVRQAAIATPSTLRNRNQFGDVNPALMMKALAHTTI